MTITLIAFAVLLAISFARVPIAFAMGIVGFAGFAMLRGVEPALLFFGASYPFAAGSRDKDLDFEPTFAPLPPEWGDTVHLDVVDAAGNMISATPSGGWLQGSPVVPGLGFPISTRGQT